MTPCFDETAKRHSKESGMATCLGLLHLVDGFGRMLGAAFALAVYGWMRTSDYKSYYWPIVVGAFLLTSSILHLVAFAIGRKAGGQTCPVLPSQPSLNGEQAAILSDPEGGT